MQDHLHTDNRALHDGGVADVASHDLDGVAEGREVLGEAVAKLSSTRTRSPSRTSSSTMWEPMKPAPPVTRQTSVPFRSLLAPDSPASGSSDGRCFGAACDPAH